MHKYNRNHKKKPTGAGFWIWVKKIKLLRELFLSMHFCYQSLLFTSVKLNKASSFTGIHKPSKINWILNRIIFATSSEVIHDITSWSPLLWVGLQLWDSRSTFAPVSAPQEPHVTTQICETLLRKKKIK